MHPGSRFSPRAALTALLLGWLTLRTSRAESAVEYKYQDYHELGGRIEVRTQGALIEQELGTDWRLKLEGVIDAIAGATPNGQPAPAGSTEVPLSVMHDRRKAWNAELSRQLQRISLSAGFANSRESDYVSNGWSLNTQTDFNEKNTRLLAGIAGTADEVNVFYLPGLHRASKHTNDAILGVTQLLNPLTALTVNVAWGGQRGYLSDPYKLVLKRIEVLPGVFLPTTFAENRPGLREKWTFFSQLNRKFVGLNGAAEASYRYYTDNYDVTAHTVELAWYQHVGKHVVLRPVFRFHDQTAARFYHYDLNTTSLVPTFGVPLRQGPFYSSDYRLSALQTTRLGLKVVWDITDRLRVDAALEAYTMRGTGPDTPQSAYPKARIVTIGARYAW